MRATMNIRIYRRWSRIGILNIFRESERILSEILDCNTMAKAAEIYSHSHN